KLAARNGPVALYGMRAVVRYVTQVVDEVRGARSRTVGKERSRRFHPLRRLPELRREQKAGEEQQVLRPLPWTQSDEGGTRRSAARLQLDDRSRLRVHTRSSGGKAAASALLSGSVEPTPLLM